MPRLLFALGLAVALAACTSDPAAEAASSDAPSATETDAETFADACQAAADWDRALCDCAADLADDELSETAYRFVVATLRDDPAATERLRADLSFEEATQAGLFMVRAGRECAAM